MGERLVPIGAALLLGIALVVGSLFLADGIRDRGRSDVITVTGSAKKRIVSDYVVWNASVASQRSSPTAAARELDSWTRQIESFLRASGIRGAELTVQPISTETVTDDAGQTVGYRLSRYFQIRSPRVDTVAGVAERSAGLLRKGIPLAAEPPQYVYTQLASARPELLAEATKDAQNRAQVLVGATGGELGSLRDVNVGVFQITSPNSTEVADYGVYDTSTLAKDVTAVVNVTFALQ